GNNLPSAVEPEPGGPPCGARTGGSRSESCRGNAGLLPIAIRHSEKALSNVTREHSSGELKKPRNEAREPRPLVSLFCGCGGLDLGFREAGFQPLLAIDKDAMACRTYELNHPGVRVLKQDLS